jgi:hypothetical protein
MGRLCPDVEFLFVDRTTTNRRRSPISMTGRPRVPPESRYSAAQRRAVRGVTRKIRAASSMEMNGRPRRSSSVSASALGSDVAGELTYPL